MTSNSPSPNTGSQPEQSRRLPAWRLWAPLALQSVLIMAIPAQDAFTYVTGTQVTLQTAPVDPYDLLRGYSQTLSYDISQPETLRQLPGAEDFFTANLEQGKAIYVVLEAPKSTDTKPPAPWRPMRVSASRPSNLEDNQIGLKGEYMGGRVIYGLETYYMPEEQRNQLNTDISQVQRQNQQAFVVEVRVDSQGNSVPVSLWVSDRNYHF